MADSPVGAAGWILEKFGQWADLPKLADGSPDIWSKFTEEQMLTNIMRYIAPSAGGHFAALEQPELMLADFRKFILTASGEQG